MKKDIHPDYKEAHVTCGCGNSFKTRSTREKIAVEICSNCHPFYTGKQKFVDTAGMVERFARKMQKSEAMKQAAKPAGKSAAVPTANRPSKPLSSQLPGARPASLAPDIGQKAAKKALSTPAQKPSDQKS